MTRAAGGEKPAGAWTPEQVVDDWSPAWRAASSTSFAPTTRSTREVDHRRILWAAEDITRNRPALSRWHPDHAAEFAAFLEGPKPA